MKNKILFAVVYVVTLTALASVAYEIKDFVTKEPELQPEIITVPKTDNAHRNLACRIQRKTIPRFKKLVK